MKLHTNKDTFLDHAFDLRKKIFKIVLHNFHHYKPGVLFAKRLGRKQQVSRDVVPNFPPNFKMASVALSFVVRFSSEVLITIS